MPSNTPNHGYYKPDSGEDGVADELNANWDAIDASLQGLSGDGQSATFQSVDMENTSSTKVNGVVNMARHDSLQAAVDVVDEGGVLFIPDPRNVGEGDRYFESDWGTATIDKVMHIRGAGISFRDSTDSPYLTGSLFEMNSSGATTAPLFEFYNSTKNISGISVSDLGIQGFEDRAMLKFRDCPGLRLQNITLDGRGSVSTMIHMTHDCWRPRIDKVRLIRGLGDNLIHEFPATGGGDGMIATELKSTQHPNAANNAAAVLVKDASQMSIFGGLIGGQDSSVGLRLEGVRNGLFHTRHNSAALQIHLNQSDVTTNSCQDLTFWNTHFENRGNTPEHIRFGYADDCHLIGLHSNETTGTMATFKGNANRCSVRASAPYLTDGTWEIGGTRNSVGPMSPVVTSTEFTNVPNSRGVFYHITNDDTIQYYDKTAGVWKTIATV